MPTLLPKIPAMLLAVAIPVAAACAQSSPRTSAATSAQQEKQLLPRQFLLDDYRTVISADFKRLRDTGIWDELNGSALKLIVSMIEKEMSFKLDHLDRITSTQQPPPKKEGRDYGRVHQVTVLEGNRDLGKVDDDSSRYTTELVGKQEILLDGWSSDAVLQLRANVRIYGAVELLKPVLSGKPRTGRPSADVLSFTAGKENLLAYLVADTLHHPQPRKSLARMLPDAKWPEDDAPTHMCVRVLATGDEDDPHVTLEFSIRHGKDGAGLVATEKAVTDSLAKLKKMNELRLLRPILKKVEHERDGTDAVWRADLGRARQAMGLLGSLAPFMFFAGEVEVQQGPMVVPAQPAPVEVEKKKQATKPKKGAQNGNDRG